jgi:hypothetical protein
MARDWSLLKPYAHREYKFVQKDSNQGVRDAYPPKQYPGLQNGVCMGVTMHWIKEKLCTSNSWWRREGPLRYRVDRDFSNPLNPRERLRQGIAPPSGSLAAKVLPKKVANQNAGQLSTSGERNREAMTRAANSHFIYQQNHSADVLATHLRLREDLDYAPMPKNDKGANNLPVRLHAETIRDAAYELPRGRAMLIELEQPSVPGRQKPPGHAIAFYRSRGNSLYFFDPNAGVYEVSPATQPNILGLVNAWFRVYRQDADKPITWETAQNGWYRVYERNAWQGERNSSEDADQARQQMAG